MNVAAIVFAAITAGGMCVYAGFALGVVMSHRKRLPVRTLSLTDTVTINAFDQDGEFYVADATVSDFGSSTGFVTLKLAQVPPKRTERATKPQELRFP